MAVSLLQGMSRNSSGQGGGGGGPAPNMVVPPDMLQLARRTFDAKIPIMPQGREDKEAALRALNEVLVSSCLTFSFFFLWLVLLPSAALFSDSSSSSFLSPLLPTWFIGCSLLSSLNSSRNSN